MRSRRNGLGVETMRGSGDHGDGVPPQGRRRRLSADAAKRWPRRIQRGPDRRRAEGVARRGTWAIIRLARESGRADLSGGDGLEPLQACSTTGTAPSSICHSARDRRRRSAIRSAWPPDADNARRLKPLRLQLETSLNDVPLMRAYAIADRKSTDESAWPERDCPIDACAPTGALCRRCRRRSPRVADSAA